MPGMQVLAHKSLLDNLFLFHVISHSCHSNSFLQLILNLALDKKIDTVLRCIPNNKSFFILILSCKNLYI